MNGLVIILLIFIVCKILLGRDVIGGVDDHKVWTPSPITVGLKNFLRMLILVTIFAFLLACCAGM